MAGNRSAEGWHFDAHEIAGLEGIIEHINIYSKKLGFRVHLFLVNTKGNQICEIIMKLSL